MKTVAAVLLLVATSAFAQAPASPAPASAPTAVPSNLVAEGVPAFSPELIEKTRPYMEARSAGFSAWHPERAEMLITTRFADTPQLHLVKMPGGARRQITFFPDRVGGGRWLHHNPNQIVFSRDAGGNEFFQLYRLDTATGAVTLLTDGKSRNTGAMQSHDGRQIAFASTRRNGNDTDLWIVDPMAPQSARMVLQVVGGGWSATDFSHDGAKLLIHESISANESSIYVLDLKSGTKTRITPEKSMAAYSPAKFSNDDASIYFVTDDGSEFGHLVRMRISDGQKTTLSRENWGVDDFDLSEDGRRLAYVTNENGVSALHVIDAASGAAVNVPRIPQGIIGNVEWHPNNHLLGMTLSSARSSSDAYALDVESGTLQRWTESETGGLDPERNADPQLVTMKSFDGLQISAFVYRPDPAKWPGKRPVLIDIHGGPEGQSRPGFIGRTNYWINELGIAVVFPNVRGSTGYGKTFLAADNGFKREDSVKDIGTVISWIKSDPALDGARIGVYGGSYGGYMTLATMTHYNDQMRAAIDVVGISSFLTFFQNTSGYRKDLRRVEYGDEREPKMHAFFEQISPIASASKITKPLFVVAGFNDPRVPWTEGQQIVNTVRANGAPVWWLMAKDEGHGFAKKRNQDYQFLAMTEFLEQYLVK